MAKAKRVSSLFYISQPKVTQKGCCLFSSNNDILLEEGRQKAEDGRRKAEDGGLVE